MKEKKKKKKEKGKPEKTHKTTVNSKENRKKRNKVWVLVKNDACQTEAVSCKIQSIKTRSKEEKRAKRRFQTLDDVWNPLQRFILIIFRIRASSRRFVVSM